MANPVLSFAAIVQGRDSSVRATDDGLCDLVDLVMVTTGKNCNDSNEVLRDLKTSLFSKEKILTRGKRRYVTLKDAITLIMVLPGKMATELRSQFAEIIESYIRENLFSSEGRSDQVGFKRKRDEMELQRMELDGVMLPPSDARFGKRRHAAAIGRAVRRTASCCRTPKRHQL